MTKTSVLAVLLGICLTGSVLAEDEGESNFSVNGYVKLQSGVFVPLLSDLFQEHESRAVEYERISGRFRRTDTPCNPIMVPNRPCFPENHGKEAGSLSMFRTTLQLEADWTPSEQFNVHAMFRGVRSLKLSADTMAQLR